MGGASDASTGSDVAALLDAYARLLATGADRGTRLRGRLGLAVGADRALATHVRSALDLLDRRYRLREGLGSLPPEEQADAARVRAFALALPAPRPLRMILVAVGILVVTQLLTLPLSEIVLLLAPSGQGSAQLTGVFSEIADLDPSGIDNALALLLTTNVSATSLLLLIVCVAGFLVLRPRAAGDAVAQRLLDEQVAERERATFAGLGLEPPAAPRLRLAVSALPAIAGLLLAVFCLQLVVEGQLAWVTWSSVGAAVESGTIKFVPSTGLDRHPPGMEVAFEADRVAERRLGVSLDCDETCQVAHVWLKGLDREGGRSWLTPRDGEVPLTSMAASDERFGTVYRLSREQQRALARRAGGVAIGVDVVDLEGNQTSMCLPLRSGDRACPDNARLERASSFPLPFQ